MEFGWRMDGGISLSFMPHRPFWQYCKEELGPVEENEFGTHDTLLKIINNWKDNFILQHIRKRPTIVHRWRYPLSPSMTLLDAW
ncbi:hypothetical protein CEXT_101081 [Caerostris extrusa]|uniref:Uncharacterized protein n=1 Tax=Caerostris extrusa TaxID=172846 RepID=A0AAV4XER3_CAEEX|nr:hypothetical protein CEXT_101081 [Caerostris extrusa]